MTTTSARARRFVRSFALLAAGLVGGGATLGLAPTAVLPGADAATCTSSGGVSVVVDYRELGGSTLTACAPDGGGKSAAAVFAAVGVDISYATRQPGFVCRVNGVPASDPCVNASPADAYWGLWWSDGSTSSWTYASAGVGGQTVPAGGSVGWSWQQDRPSGSTVPPSVAPPVATTPTPTQSPPSTSSPTASPSSPPPTSGGGGGGSNGGTNGGKGGGKGGSGSPSSTPSPTSSPTPSGSPSASPTASPGSPSESPLDSESPSDSPSSEPSDEASVDVESPSDSPSSEPSDEASVDVESPSDSAPSGAAGAGESTPDEPARIPAAVTWSVVGLLAATIAASALVARRRRGPGTS